MARAKTPQENGSILKAIDGSHLMWNVFREDVLQPFGITFSVPTEPANLPPALLSRLQDRLEDVERFDQQRQKWRDQIANGQGFSIPTIFPPNVLPQIWSATSLQRILSPKMSREALPRRPKSASGLFELPSAKPIFATAFVTEAFSESEHQALPSSLSPMGTTVDFTNGYVGTGRILHCPFLVFERCQSLEIDDIEDALNMCAISGAQCVRGLQDILQRAHKAVSVEVYTFSCLLNDRLAIINIHKVDRQAKHVMSALQRFDLTLDDHFNCFLAWIEAIEEWACTTLLPNLKDSLTKITVSGDTPPASPMPSLALSIDTEVGLTTGLVAALRRSYPTVGWHGDTVMESPINSSIANCGTPAEGRRSQSFALASPKAGAYGNLLLRRGRGSSVISPINTRTSQISYVPARPSPFSPRHSIYSPSTACETVLESPCRPGTLSPFTPPPDQPWAAKSPMLVLQKRVDIAMDEVQELRHQVEMLQSELSAKNQQLSERLSAMELLETLKQKARDDKLRAVQLEEERLRQSRETLQAERSKCSSAKQKWIELVYKHKIWDLFLREGLFVLALFVLVAVCAMACRELFVPVTTQLPLWLESGMPWLHVVSRWLSDWRRMNRMSAGMPGLDMWQYLDVWQGLTE